jgi:regulator of protease activity HflC (stomatin/prohibitin superfamily)
MHIVGRKPMQIDAKGFMGEMDIKKYLTIIVGLFFFITAMGSFYTIDSGYVGVIQRLGKYNEVPVTPGLHWKLPFIDTVHKIDVKLQTVNYSGTQDEQDSDGIIFKPQLDVLDAKNVHYDIELTILFTPVGEKMPAILTTYGSNYYDKKLNPIVRDVVRDVGGKYNVESIADHRDGINTEIKQRLAEEFKSLPFLFEEAALRQLKLPGNIMQKIVAVQEAKQEEERLKIVNRQAEQNKQITITNAEAEKEKVVIAAQAEAESVSIRAKAQAEANRRIADSLTPLLVRQNEIERWDGTVPATLVSEGKSGMLLSIGSGGGKQ